MPKYTLIPPAGEERESVELDMSFREARRLVEEVWPGWRLVYRIEPNWLTRTFCCLVRYISVILGLATKKRTV